LFVSISQVIGCEDRLRNDLDCVGWGVKLYSHSNPYARNLLGLIIKIPGKITEYQIDWLAQL